MPRKDLSRLPMPGDSARCCCSSQSHSNTPRANWDHLIDVLHLFRDYPLAVEVRHKTWADPLVLKALRQENIAFCNIDQTRLGQTLEGTQYVTASLAYLRLHGRSKEWFTAKNRDARYDYLYSKESLQKVKGKIESMAAEAEVTFVAANNHPRGQAAANAVELKSLLSGEKVSAPETLVKTYPVLEEFAVPESMGDLTTAQDENSGTSQKETRTQRGKREKDKPTKLSKTYRCNDREGKEGLPYRQELGAGR